MLQEVTAWVILRKEYHMKMDPTPIVISYRDRPKPGMHKLFQRREGESTLELFIWFYGNFDFQELNIENKK